MPMPSDLAVEIPARITRAQALAGEAGLDALLVIGRSFYDRPGNLAYLTNHFPPFPASVFAGEFRGLGHGILLLPAHGEPVLITDPRGARRDLVPIADIRSAGDLVSALARAIRDRGLDRSVIGVVDDDILPAAMERSLRDLFPDAEFRPAPGLLGVLRRIKSPREIAQLREAAICADAGLMAAVEAIQRPGITEREVCAIGTAACLRAGADFVRYFRVHSGPWSAVGSRWPPATDRPINAGEIVVLDAIGAVDGYGFDVNRTTVCGTPDDDTRVFLDAVDHATAAAVAAAVAGRVASEIHRASCKAYEPSPWSGLVGSMVGHGLGIETVELPYLTADATEILLPRMVLCIEPGIFIAGERGAAIEQEVVIRDGGPPEILTPTPTKLW